MEFLRAEIRPGGTSFYRMSGQGGMTMHGRVHYLSFEKPHRIVYTQQFCDEHEKIARHPMAPTWPETMLTTVTLSEEGPESTRVTVVWEPHGPTTPEERDTFIQARGGMTVGWTGSFDKLEAILPKGRLGLPIPTPPKNGASGPMSTGTSLAGLREIPFGKSRFMGETFGALA